MCDFHSIIVRRDGAKAHVMTNSHSGAVKAAGWRENDQMTDFSERGPFFTECEWSGVGEYPGAESVSKSSINEKQRKAIDLHYQALAKFVSNPGKNAAMLFDAGYFFGDEYGDLRWKALVHPECPKQFLLKLAQSPLHSDGYPIKSLHPAVKEVSGDVIVEQGATLTAPELAE
jgi:hypothetical protein